MIDKIKIPVSVYIITLNEADKIAALLNQLSRFEEVIVVDCGSTDKTAAIAGDYANVKFYHRNWVSFSEQKAYALSLCRCDWVLNIDADEELSEEFIDEMLTTMALNHSDALEARRIVYRWGRRTSYFTKDNRLIRFFRKHKGHYEPRRVHERISISGRVRRSNAAILHHQDMSLDELVAKLNRYSQLKAMDKFEKGRRAHFLVLLFIFPLSFVQHYILKGFCLGGYEGLNGSVTIAFYDFMKYAKLWELQHLKQTQSGSLSAVARNPHI